MERTVEEGALSPEGYASMWQGQCGKDNVVKVNLVK